MQNTEKDTPTLGKRIYRAFIAQDGAVHQNAQQVFEHGQWWINCSTCGAQWSANDSNALNGFSFEQVSNGDDFCEENASVLG